MREIVLIGSGWGYKALYLGFKNYKEKLYILTEDENIKKKRKENHELIKSINEIENKIIICAGYQPIIQKKILDRNTIINIHYSLLPKYRGLHSTVWAILNGEEKLGLTVHLMNEYIDDGDIIYQYFIENDEKYTSKDFMEIFNKNIQENIQEIIEKFLKKEIIPIKQDKKNATWVGKRNIEDCRINFTWTIEQLKRLFRALVEPYPLPFLSYKGIDYEVLDVDYHYANCKTHVGRVLNIDNDGVYIKVNDGYLIVKKLRCKETKIVLEAKNLIKSFGYRFK